MTPYIDQVHAVVSDQNGAPHVLFVRSREGGIIPITRVMVQDAAAQVYHIRRVFTRGVFSKNFVFELQNKTGKKTEITLHRYWATNDDVFDQVLYEASRVETARGALDYIPADFWTGLDFEHLDRAERLLKGQ